MTKRLISPQLGPVLMHVVHVTDALAAAKRVREIVCMASHYVLLSQDGELRMHHAAVKLPDAAADQLVGSYNCDATIRQIEGDLREFIAERRAREEK